MGMLVEYPGRPVQVLTQELCEDCGTRNEDDGYKISVACKGCGTDRALCFIKRHGNRNPFVPYFFDQILCLATKRDIMASKRRELRQLVFIGLSRASQVPLKEIQEVGVVVRKDCTTIIASADQP
jgi:hypothetical protein